MGRLSFYITAAKRQEFYLIGVDRNTPLRYSRYKPPTPTMVQDFFRREAFLTGSGQLNFESCCPALMKVYTFGPTFPGGGGRRCRQVSAVRQSGGISRQEVVA